MIAGTTYTAYLPVATPDYTADAPSIMRKVNGEEPVIDVTSVDYTCGEGAVPIEYVYFTSTIVPNSYIPLDLYLDLETIPPANIFSPSKATQE